MNPKGTKENLKAAHPGNSHAQKSGLHSERVRAEKARKVRESLDQDPLAALDNNLRDRYCDQEALRQLLQDDVTKNGVSDRYGKPRRQVGSLNKAGENVQRLADRIRASIIGAAINDDDAPPWTRPQIRRRLQAIADDPSLPTAARVQAMLHLHKDAPEGKMIDWEFYSEIEEMTDEELESEFRSFQVPLMTRRRDESGESVLRKTRLSVRDQIRSLGAQPEITEWDVALLRDTLNTLFDPKSEPPLVDLTDSEEPSPEG